MAQFPSDVPNLLAAHFTARRMSAPACLVSNEDLLLANKVCGSAVWPMNCLNPSPLQNMADGHFNVLLQNFQTNFALFQRIMESLVQTTNQEDMNGTIAEFPSNVESKIVGNDGRQPSGKLLNKINWF
jgi:Na+/phosphate symporter